MMVRAVGEPTPQPIRKHQERENEGTGRPPRPRGFQHRPGLGGPSPEGLLIQCAGSPQASAAFLSPAGLAAPSS